MTRRKPLQRMAALLLCVFLCLGAAFSMMGAAYAANVEPSGITIEIMLPTDWASTSAAAKVCVTDETGKAGDRMENPLVIHPALELAGNGRGAGPVIDHHIGVVAHAPQGFHPVEVLLMGAAVVGQHIDLPFADILDRGQPRP